MVISQKKKAITSYVVVCVWRHNTNT